MTTTEVKFFLDDPEAKVPTKGTPYSIGYDLTAIKVHSKIGTRTTLYDTGLIIQPPQGYYTEIVPRSSISKTGYMLSNSVGTIDWDYRGRLLIALTKVDDSLPDLEVPFTRCQLVLRKSEYYFPKIVSSKEELETTERGEGCFGSTDMYRYVCYSCSSSKIPAGKCHRYFTVITENEPDKCPYCGSGLMCTVVEGAQCSKCNRVFKWGSYINTKFDTEKPERYYKPYNGRVERLREIQNIFERFFRDQANGHLNPDVFEDHIKDITKETVYILSKIKEEISKNKYSEQDLEYIKSKFGDI